MLAQLRIKLKDAESAVAFLQTQHAKTLEGLHKEIQKLQQQNAKLTFELAVAGPQRGQSSTAGHQCRCKLLEADLDQSKAEILSLKSTVAHQEEVTSLLQHQNEQSRRTFSAELKEKDERISTLLKEVEDKSNAAATLTQQLHKSHVLLKKALEEQAESSLLNAAEMSERELPHPTRRTRRMHRTVSNPSSGNEKLYSQVDVSCPYTSGQSPSPSSSGASRLSFSASSVNQRLAPPSDMAHSLLIPSPPTPHPPSTSPSRSSVRRASNPIRKSAQPQCSPMSGFLMMPTHTTSSIEECTDPATGLAQQLKLGPVQLRKHSNPPPDVASVLKGQGTQMQVVTKPPPPVLPPIRLDTNSPPQVPISQTQSDPSLPQKGSSLEGEDGTTLAHDCTIIVGTRVHLSQGHRHIILTKSQGGVVSTPSTLRVVQYGGAGAGEDPSEGMEEEETAEGTLMVKENVSRKDQAWQELHQHGAD